MRVGPIRKHQISTPKNWCFWIVVLEKTLDSPLDSKEIKPVNPKGNQPWIFIGRTYAEAEAPILWPPDVRNWFIGKDPDAGKDRAGGEGSSREIVGWHHHHLNEHEFEQTPGDGEGQGSLACCSPWCCKETHDLATEQVISGCSQTFFFFFFFPTNLCINNSLTNTSSFRETAYINQTLESARCGCQPYITTHLLVM